MGLLTNLISYWSMEDASGTVMTDVHGANDGTTSNVTEGVTGKIGNAFDTLSWTSGYMIVPDDDTLDLAGNYTISYWVNPQSTIAAGDRVILGKVNAGSSGYMHYTGSAGGGGGGFFSFTYGNTTTNPLALAGGNLTIGSWVHIVETYDGAKRTLYRDGSFSASATTTGSITANSLDLWIGRYYNNNTRYYDMLFDELGMWDRALSSTEVSELYNGGAGLAYSGFVTSVPITVSAGTQSSTITPKAVTVTANRTVTVSADTQSSTITPKAVTAYGDALLNGIDHYYKLNGDLLDSVGSDDGASAFVTYNTGIISSGITTTTTAAYLQLASTDTNFSANTATWSMWVQIPSLAERSLLDIAYTAHTTPYYAQEIRTDTLGRIFTSSNKGGTFEAYTPAGIPALTANTWAHIVVVFDGGKQTIYQNGTLIGDNGLTPGTTTFYGTEVLIGQMKNLTNPNGLNCKFDEIGYWSRELNQGEVTKLYAEGAGLSYPFVPEVPVTVNAGKNSLTTTAKAVTVSPIINIVVNAGKNSLTTTAKAVTVDTVRVVVVNADKQSSSITAKEVTVDDKVQVNVGKQSSVITAKEITVSPIRNISVDAGKQSSVITAKEVTVTDVTLVSAGKQALIVTPKAVTVSPIINISVDAGKQSSVVTAKTVTVTDVEAIIAGKQLLSITPKAVGVSAVRNVSISGAKQSSILTAKFATVSLLDVNFEQIDKVSLITTSKSRTSRITTSKSFNSIL